MNLDMSTGAPGIQLGVSINSLFCHCGRISGKKQLKGRKAYCGSGFEGTSMSDRRGGKSDWRLWRQEHDPAGLFWVD